MSAGDAARATSGRLARRVRALPTAVLVAGAVALALLLGATTGGTLALWRDTATVQTRMPAGVVVLGAGTPAAPGQLADYATSATDTAEVPFGPAQASTLYTTGSVAVPFQVDSLAQGHRGLRYTVTPEVSGGVFGRSTVRVVRVASAAACTTALTGTATGTSTPWSGAYTTTTALLPEYWCLVATFDRVKGSYANTASVEATVTTSGGTSAGTVAASASWAAQVMKTLVPANEPAHRVRVAFQTFRGTTP